MPNMVCLRRLAIHDFEGLNGIPKLPKGKLTATKLSGRKTKASPLSLATALLWAMFSSSKVFHCNNQIIIQVGSTPSFTYQAYQIPLLLENRSRGTSVIVELHADSLQSDEEVFPLLGLAQPLEAPLELPQRFLMHTDSFLERQCCRSITMQLFGLVNDRARRIPVEESLFKQSTQRNDSNRFNGFYLHKPALWSPD
jgi:hypothetical protein